MQNKIAPINVLSLFDGISCGQVALQRANIPVATYFASEIDKYAIKITQKNFPKTIQLGDITKLKYKNGIFYNDKDYWDVGQIDLLLGGSPCQGFSFAGKQLNFDDPRSKLFFEYVRLLKELNPKYFLLENVRMKKEYQDVISKELEVEPILINSALISAHDRKRIYWTNIQGITQPEDKHIYLKDILENGITDRKKSYCIDANYFKGGNLEQYFKKHRRQLIFDKSCVIGKLTNYQGDRIFDTNCKGSSLSAQGGNQAGGSCNLIIDQNQIRKLTPIECERLQTLPDNYTEGISDSQRYKCLGNGWTVDVIAHILSFMK